MVKCVKDETVIDVRERERESEGVRVWWCKLECWRWQGVERESGETEREDSTHRAESKDT